MLANDASDARDSHLCRITTLNTGGRASDFFIWAQGSSPCLGVRVSQGGGMSTGVKLSYFSSRAWLMFFIFRVWNNAENKYCANVFRHLGLYDRPMTAHHWAGAYPNLYRQPIHWRWTESHLCTTMYALFLNSGHLCTLNPPFEIFILLYILTKCHPSIRGKHVLGVGKALCNLRVELMYWDDVQYATWDRYTRDKHVPSGYVRIYSNLFHLCWLPTLFMSHIGLFYTTHSPQRECANCNLSTQEHWVVAICTRLILTPPSLPTLMLANRKIRPVKWHIYTVQAYSLLGRLLPSLNVAISPDIQVSWYLPNNNNKNTHLLFTFRNKSSTSWCFSVSPKGRLTYPEVVGLHWYSNYSA